MCLLLVFLVLAASAGWAQDSTIESEDSAKPAPVTKKPAKPLLASGLDMLKLPANAVVVILEKVAEGFSSEAAQIILTPAAYKKLLDRNAELERRLSPDKPIPPSTCLLKITGSMDGDSAHLRAEFKFKAEKDKTLIALDCRGASPQKPELDGKEALLQSGDEGLSVQVDAGQHVLTLDLDAAVKAGDATALEGGARRVLRIDLPRAAVTSVEFEQLPSGAKEVRCNDKVARKPGEPVALGAARELSLSWVKPVALPAGGPWLTADGVITVRVEEQYVITEALFTLQDLRKQNTRWVLETPPQTEVEVVPLDKGEPRVPVHKITFSKNRQEHVIDLSEPTGDAIGIFARCRQPRRAGRVLVGPFQVLQAAGRLRRQQGTLRIKAPPTGLRLIQLRTPESLFHVSPVEITDKDRLDSILYRYSYWSLPQPSRPAAAKSGPALLELEVKTVTGMVKTRVDHLLELRENEHGWEVQATTRIHAQPVRSGVSVIEVQLPKTWPASLAVALAWPRPGLPVNLALAAWGGDGRSLGVLWPFTASYKLEPSAQIVDRNGLTDPIEDLTVDDTGKLRLVLPEKKDTDFTLTIRGTYALSAREPRAVLGLPVPVSTRDQGGEARISVPSGQQLLIGDAGHATPAAERSRHTISSEAALDRVEFSWRPNRPELPVTVVADVTLRHSRADVRQLIQLPTAQQPLAGATLQLVADARLVPAVVATARRSLKHGSAGKAHSPVVGAGPWSIPLSLEKDRVLELRYTFPVPAEGVVHVPLFELKEATRNDTTVRVWSYAGPISRTMATVQGARWDDAKIRQVSGRDQLPILELHGHERNLPLSLLLRQVAVPSLATAIVERGLIRANRLPGGGYSYRARFRLEKLSTPSLNIELPPSAARIMVRLNELRVTPVKTTAPDAGSPSQATQLQIDTDPAAFPGAVLLEVSYELGGANGAAGTEGDSTLGSLQTTLYPPVLPHVLFGGKVRWQIDPAPAELVLNPGWEATSEERWGLRGWLLASRPALTTAELERWLTGKEGAAETEPTLLCAQTTPEPLHLIRVARKTWLLMCSLLFLALGLGLSFAPLVRGPLRVLCWAVVVLISLAVIASVLAWPGILPDVLYGCEPGLAVLVPILVVQWMVQKRYRRQLVFMPGFTRLKTGSSLVRAGANSRAAEPSTVDKPPPEGSPQRQGSAKE
jgi:hypothetical protein